MVTVLAIPSPWRSASGGGSGWVEHSAPPRSSSGTAGRATGVTDRGQRSAVAYDDRGNAIWTARQMAMMPFSAPILESDLSGDHPVLQELGSFSFSNIQYDAEPSHTVTAQRSRDDCAGRLAHGRARCDERSRTSARRAAA